jgi:cleavage stimulation factor subunit 2
MPFQKKITTVLTTITGGTEELIIETLERVGKVLNFRLVYDKETGKPKGFGFAEFEDADAAASAVRNLNNFDLMGRQLRVDWSKDNGAGDNDNGASYNAPSNYNPGAPNGQAPMPSAPPAALPPIPPGSDLPPNVTAPDAISRTLSTLPIPQLLDILSQMKGLVMSDPGKATELLRQAPQLSYAIFQSLLLLGLVDPQVIGGLVEPASAPAAAPPQQTHTPYQPPPQAQPPRPPQNYTGYPAPVPTPPQQLQQYAQPPPQHQQYPQQPQQPQQPPVDPQAAAYAQIMAMTPQQIDALAPEYKAQIQQIRHMIMSGR